MTLWDRLMRPYNKFRYVILVCDNRNWIVPMIIGVSVFWMRWRELDKKTVHINKVWAMWNVDSRNNGGQTTSANSGMSYVLQRNIGLNLLSLKRLDWKLWGEKQGGCLIRMSSQQRGHTGGRTRNTSWTLILLMHNNSGNILDKSVVMKRCN